MAEKFLTSEVAQSIKEALLNDGTFSGTEEWADAHGFDLDEYARFLDFGVDLAKMYEWRARHEDVAPMVETKAIVEKGVVDKKGAKLTVAIPGKSLAQVEPLVDEECVLQFFPVQMPLPLGDNLTLVDVETGEVVGG